MVPFDQGEEDRWKTALSLFRDLQEQERPDGVSYMMVISACAGCSRRGRAPRRASRLSSTQVGGSGLPSRKDRIYGRGVGGGVARGVALTFLLFSSLFFIFLHVFTFFIDCRPTLKGAAALSERGDHGLWASHGVGPSVETLRGDEAALEAHVGDAERFAVGPGGGNGVEFGAASAARPPSSDIDSQRGLERL